MPLWLILVAALAGLLVCVGLSALFVRYLLLAPGADDDDLSFDPLQRMPPDRGPWIWNYLHNRFFGPRRLTYRRDVRGRFRRLRR